jgi:hypothetical protein
MWSSFTLTNPDSPDKLQTRLTNNLAKPTPFFRGQVTDRGFKVTRIPGTFEKTIPVVAYGRFESTSGGDTVIHVQMRVPIEALIFAASFTGACLWSGYTAVGNPIWFFVGVIVFMWFLLFIVTVTEERWCQEELIRIFTGRVSFLAQP